VTVAVLTVIVGNCNCELQSINQSINHNSSSTDSMCL